MKNELSSSFLRDGSEDFGNGVIGPSSAERDYFNSINEVQGELIKEKIIPIRNDSRLGKAIGLKFGSRLLPVAGVLSLIAMSCSGGEIKESQQGTSNSELPSPTSEFNNPVISTPTPSPRSTETPMPTATLTPEPRPTETPTLFPTKTLTPTPTPKIEPVVKPILFVPANLSMQEDDIVNVNNAMKQTQRFYAEQLDGKTFKYDDVVLIRGQKDLKFYCPKTIVEDQCIQVPGKIGADSGDIFNVINDIRIQDPTYFNKGQVIIIFWVGGYGFAAGAQSSQDSGFVALGDWALDSIGGRYGKKTDIGGCRTSPYAIAFCRDNPLGVIHELGHALGLPHPNIDNTKKGDGNFWTLSAMDGCEWPECKFLNSDTNLEKQALIKSPFMHVVIDIKN